MYCPSTREVISDMAIDADRLAADLGVSDAIAYIEALRSRPALLESPADLNAEADRAFRAWKGLGQPLAD
jgi:hypothetical protein